MAVAAPRRADNSALSSANFERDLDYRHQITARADRVRWLVIPARRYLMIDGTDAPASQGFRDAIGTMYPVAYTLHFDLKKRGIQAPVGTLEGLYWIDKPGPTAAAQFVAGHGHPRGWTWRLMLPAPDEATSADFAAAVDTVAAKKRPPLLDQLRFEAWEEGPVAQIMHVGPYDAEAPTMERLHEAIAAAGLRPRGCHHEIYISDPGRTAPERLKTLIRQPVEPT